MSKMVSQKVKFYFLILVDLPTLIEVRCTIKTSSMKAPVTQIIPIAIVDKKIVQNGEVKELDSAVSYDPQEFASLLPKRVEEGPKLHEVLVESWPTVTSQNPNATLEVSFKVCANLWNENSNIERA
jgi:hypothetical protein